MRNQEDKDRNVGVTTNVGSQNLRYEHIQERRQGAALPNSPRQIEKGRQVTIHIHSTLNTRIERSTQEMKDGPNPIADSVERMNPQSTRSKAFS